MTKDAFYFPHDSNAKDDPKCTLMIEQMGLEGYGIFWVLIETLRDQPEFKYPLSLVPSIARKYNTTPEKVKIVITQYGFFDIENDAFFYSNSLRKRMLPLINKREKARLAGLASAESRRSRLALYANNEHSTYVEQTLNDCSTNVQPREEKRKEESIKEENRENNTITGVVGDVMSFFSFNEQNNFDKLRIITQFATLLHTTDKLELFKTQFTAYKLYKHESGEKTHGFHSFLGLPEYKYLNGGWNAENWSAKLGNLTTSDTPMSADDKKSKVMELLNQSK